MTLDTTGGSALISTVDPNVLLGLAIAVAVTLLLALIPVSKGNLWLTLLSFLAAVVFHGRAFPGFVIVTGIAYLAVRALDTRSNRSERWNWACALLVAR